MNFGTRLTEERKRIGLNQKDFAEIGGVTKTSQVNYESGERSPNVDYLQAIASTGVDVQYILTGIRTSGIAVEMKDEIREHKPKKSSFDVKVAKMAELLEGLNEDQQREIFTIAEEKKRLNNLELTAQQFLRAG